MRLSFALDSSTDFYEHVVGFHSLQVQFTENSDNVLRNEYFIDGLHLHKTGYEILADVMSRQIL